MHKVFRYRLYPTASQRERLESTLETCRRFYNDCLSERKAVYETEGKTLRQFEQAKRIKVHRKTNPHAAEVPSHVLQVVVADLQKAFNAFFRRVKNGEKAGYPRFKGKGRFHSFGYKEYGTGFKVDGRRLHLTWIGRIAVRWHRRLQGKIKTLRVCVKNGTWYACFCCEVESQPLPHCEQEVGIDVGLTHLLTLSTGTHIENPRFYKDSQAKLRVLQRAASRKKKGSNNQKKAYRQAALHCEHVANQRKDYLNKVVATLIATFGYIAIEDLNVSAMAKGWLSKSIMDAGWGYFRQRLLSKAENAGRRVELVDPAYTSQDCYQCGARQKLTLKDRWYYCPKCGNSRDRDENAALNVLRLGRSRWAPSSSVEGFAHEAVAGNG